jgi:diguanylate cyclase (GGDEF)-like protein
MVRYARARVRSSWREWGRGGGPRIQFGRHEWAAVGLTVFFVAVTVAGVMGTGHTRAAAKGATSAVRTMSALQTVQYLAAQEHAAISDYLSNGRPSDVTAHAAAARQMSQALDSLHSEAQAKSVPLISKLIAEHTRYLTVAPSEISLIRIGDLVAAQKIDNDQTDPAFATMGAQIAQLEGAALTAGTGDMKVVARQTSFLSAATPMVLGIAWLIGLAFAFALRRQQRKLYRAARTDPLTGLANRAELQKWCERAVAVAARSVSEPVLLLLDLDRFKEVNDTLGHHLGDQLLVQVGERIGQDAPATALVVRLGGDEFAVLLADGGASAGEQTAQRVREALQQTFTVAGMALDIDVSIGIAVLTAGETASSLLRRADVAMYVAKETQTGAATYSAELDEHTTHALALMSEIRHALDHDELIVHYQPKIAVADGTVFGAEALVRWQHPTRGLLPPREFIPQVETTQLIYGLTIQVLTKALRQCQDWRSKDITIPVAVNVASRCFLDPEFPATVKDLLERFGLDPHLLVLEITETTVITDLPRATRAMQELHDIGVGLSVDNYGAGYSALTHLRDLPLTELKIDKHLVRDLAHSDHDAALVKSIIQLGHRFGLKVVAQGIEEPGAYERLRTLNCDLAQGHGIAKPMDNDTFTTWLGYPFATRDRRPSLHPVRAVAWR